MSKNPNFKSNNDGNKEDDNKILIIIMGNNNETLRRVNAWKRFPSFVAKIPFNAEKNSFFLIVQR